MKSAHHDKNKKEGIMFFHKYLWSLVFFSLAIVLPIPILGEIGISFSTGYGFPLPFEYAGNTFSDRSSYKEVWSSFGNGLKFNPVVSG